MKCTLELTGTLTGKFKVLAFGYNLFQSVDPSGRPGTEVMCSELSFSVYPEDREKGYDNTFFKWLMTNEGGVNGEITYYKSEQGGEEMKKITFEDGFCTSFNESTSAYGEELVHDISVAVQTAKFDDIDYRNMWLKE